MLAAALHVINPGLAADVVTITQRKVWYQCVCAVADTCSEDNDAFNRYKFVLACETGKGIQ